MFEGNPTLIQDPSGRVAQSRLPLVLIHDGGGTCFGYWCLEDLDRRVYGIHNPNFESGEPREGGIPAVAGQYVELVRKVIPRGRFILGGWSFGGMVSLQMARLLAEDEALEIAGLIMIDSPCPIRLAEAANRPIVPHKHTFSDRTKLEIRGKVMRCFAEAGKMASTWTLPLWGNSISSSQATDPASPSATIHRLKPPPAILLRAEELVPVEAGPDGAVVPVDRWRPDRLLGWAEYRPDLFYQVIDVPGHHYNLFAEEHIDAMTAKLNEACWMIEDAASTA